jgi:flagellar protein FliO/FliZ
VTPFVLAQATLPGAATDLVPSVWRTGASLLVVLAILAAGAWMLRRVLAGRKASGAMNVETALPLGERRSLVIVAVEGRRLLLGLTPGQISMVTELRAATPAQTPFETVLSHSTAQGPRA